MTTRWPLVALGELLTQDKNYINKPEARLYPKLSVKLYGRGVVLDEPASGQHLKMKRHQLAKAGQVILSEIWGKKGAIGIVPAEGQGALCTSHFFLFDIHADRVLRQWLNWILRANYLESQLGVVAKGSTGYAAVRPKHLLDARIPLPDLPEQERLAVRLDALSARLAEARRLHDELADEQQEFVAAFARPDLSQRAKQDAGWRKSRLSEVLTERVEPVAVEKKKQYPTIGVYSFARGIIRKPPILGSETKATRLYRVRAGQFIYGRLGGYEGAFGFVPPWADGACVSGEFPAFDCKPDALLAEYLFAYFNSPQVWKTMSDACRGLAGRRIRLKESAFLAHELWLPPLSYQQTVRDTLRQIETARALHADLPAELDALQSALLDRAFKGEL